MKRKSILIWGTVAALLALLWWPRPEPAPKPSPRPARHSDSAAFPRHRTTRNLSLGPWKREVESLFRASEAQRSRLLSRKDTVDSSVFLIAVEPPADDEIQALRAELDDLTHRSRPEEHADRTAELERIIADYDPFGHEGKRAIVIDLPHDSSGRLTGFTCTVGDFHEISRRFEEGTMTELENLRAYAAIYAGMPLIRFKELVTACEAE